MQMATKISWWVWRTPRTQSSIFAYRRLTHDARWCWSQTSFSFKFLCSFCPRKTKRNQKKTHQRPAPANAEFYIQTLIPWQIWVVNFSDHFNSHSNRLRNFALTQLVEHAHRMQQQRQTFYGGSINVITCVWEFVDITRWNIKANMINMTSSASDKSKDRRT